jgi:hypothetical protein
LHVTQTETAPLRPKVMAVTTAKLFASDNIGWGGGMH